MFLSVKLPDVWEIRCVVPQDSSRDEDQVDVVEVQGEGEDHHAQKRQAVHDQGCNPGEDKPQ